MENSFDTSFIPQQPLLKVEGTLRRREPVNFALVLAFVIFFVSLGVSGWMYFYKATIDQRILALEIQLESKEASLKINDIDRYKAIDARMIIAKKLLQNHTAFSIILTLLERITARDVGLTSLSYSTDEKDGSIKLLLSGQAPSYSAVYAQAESWRKLPTTLRDVRVDMPMLSPETGVVSFNATLVIDPNYAKYVRLIKSTTTANATKAKTATTPVNTATTPTSAGTTTGAALPAGQVKTSLPTPPSSGTTSARKTP